MATGLEICSDDLWLPASGYVIRYEHACSVLSRYLSRNNCQKSATDVELKLLTVIPDTHCSSYESRARQRVWSAVETTEINAMQLTYFTSLSRMQQF